MKKQAENVKCSDSNPSQELLRQSGDREEGFHLLGEELKLEHGRFCTWFRMSMGQLLAPHLMRQSSSELTSPADRRHTLSLRSLFLLGDTDNDFVPHRC